jgi:NitT/TauT family transport system substrate-binding protein
MLKKTIGVYTGAILLSVTLAIPVRAQELKNVKIGIGTPVINVTYPWLNMPEALGWWREAGLNVTLVPVSGSLQATQLLAAGSIDYAEMNTATIIQANVNNNIPIRVIMANTVIDWSIVSLKDGPVKKPADLKGTAIGVLSLASSGTALLQAYLAKNGLDPNKDVKIVATGAGAPALQALNSNRVQALMFWGSMNTSFENQGAKLNYFYLDEWRRMPDFSLVALQSKIDAEPDVVKKIALGVAKGSAFAFDSPECVRKVQWSNYPQTKPSGAPDDATAAKWDDNNLKASMKSMKSAFDAGGGKLWGATSAADMDMVQQFMLQTKQITTTIPAATYLIADPNFWTAVNDFDAAALKKVADECPIE